MKVIAGYAPILLILSVVTISASAQTTAFTYQGSLTDGGTPAAGAFQMQFKLFDAASGGFQIGPTLNDIQVTASNGVFSTKLDFGASPLSGANRWLEIAVRRNSGESYVTLSPREQFASAPYSVRTLSAATADDLSAACVGCIENSNIDTVAGTKVTGTVASAATAANATNASQLGGVAGNQFVQTTDQRLSDARNPLPGSPNYIQNGADLQPSTSFNISGNGFVGGNFGVGTTAPASKLDVAGTFRAIRNDSNDVVVQTTGGTNAWARFWAITPNQAWALGTSRNFNGGQFYINDVTGEQTRMTIHPFGGPIAFPFGNVGIGTSSPNTRLTINGGVPWTSNGWTASMNLQNGSAIGWATTSSNQAYGIGQSNGGLYFFRTGSPVGNTQNPALYSIVIAEDGRVGIGTTTPQTMLTVNGLITTDITEGAGVPLCHRNDGLIVGCSSTIRLKENVTTLDSAYDLVKQLRPVSYTWSSSKKPDIGLIAEEVVEIDPRLVTHNDKGEILGVRYDHLTALLINTIQQQQGQLEELQRRLMKQDERFKRQQKQIDDLRKVVRLHKSGL